MQWSVKSSWLFAVEQIASTLADKLVCGVYYDLLAWAKN